MKRKRFTEEQIIGVLNEAEQTGNIREVCRVHNISESVGDSSPLPSSTSDKSIYVKYGTEELSPRGGAGIGEVAVAQWKEAGLLKPSVLKPVVATIERGLVLRKLGRLEEEDRQALRGVLDVVLGS